VATSTNYSEIIALFEASCECVWLRQMINHIEKSCGIDSVESPTIIYEDNAACITQMQKCYIKSNITKHIAPKLFYPHELQQSGEINILQKSIMIIWQISLPSPYLLPYSKNVSRELVLDGSETCKL